MPLVNIKIVEGGVTPTQKAELIAGITDLLQQVLGKNPANTMVLIDEVSADNWGVAGETVAARMRRQT